MLVAAKMPSEEINTVIRQANVMRRRMLGMEKLLESGDFTKYKGVVSTNADVAIINGR